MGAHAHGVHGDQGSRAALTQALSLGPRRRRGHATAGSCGLSTSARSVRQAVGQSYVTHSLGPGTLATGGRKAPGSRGPPAVPTPGPQAGLRLPTWAAQEPQDTGTGSRLLYWPRGRAQGGARRPERAVPGMGTGRARAVPGMTVVGRGPDARARHGVPTGAPGVFVYKTRREGTCGCNDWPPLVAPRVPAASPSSGESVPGHTE